MESCSQHILPLNGDLSLGWESWIQAWENRGGEQSCNCDLESSADELSGVALQACCATVPHDEQVVEAEPLVLGGRRSIPQFVGQ
jgi:hypothetical protein